MRPLVPGTNVQLLSDPGKMPGHAFGIPAGKSCPGAVTGEGSICGGCYAQQGHYSRETVQHAQRVRYTWTLECLMTPAGRESWVSVMMQAITWAATDGSRGRKGSQYFRIHDSGDFFSPAYVAMWQEVCTRLPEIHFWAPTRSYRLPRLLVALQALQALPNVTVRPSALYVNESTPRVDGLAPGSGVVRTDFTCPSSLQSNRCRECRACWLAPFPVTYKLHTAPILSRALTSD